MLGLIRLVRRTIEGFIISILTISVVAVFGLSDAIAGLLAARDLASILFMLVIVVVLADLIGKFIAILGSTFPDLIPAVGDDELRRASLIQRLRPVQTVALLSGAYTARLAMFLALFALMGTSYALAPQPVQQSLFGPLGVREAIEIFLREGLAGSIGYFLFFLGPDTLGALTGRIVPGPLDSATLDGEILLVGIRLYGLAFVLSLLRTLVIPITYLRARRRAGRLPVAGSPGVSPT
jgi:hypothetical protein